jgi:Leucine-rich repeat (LRR) protein
VRLEAPGHDDETEDADQVPEWMQPLQTLSGIPGLQLRVKWVHMIDNRNDPDIAVLLKQHGHLISNLTVNFDVNNDWLTLRELAEAAATCRSIHLTMYHFSDEVVDLNDLNAVSGSLQCLICQPIEPQWGTLRGASAINSMSQLTALHIGSEDLGIEEPWSVLASMSKLHELHLDVRASGDPAPLSALTGLTCLSLLSHNVDQNRTPFTFSSLQPLSTLLQLEELHLVHEACTATSLQGVAGLSKLKVLELLGPDNGLRLRSLEGISPGVVDIYVSNAPDLVTLAGIEFGTSIQGLSFIYCGVSSLQPLGGLSSLKELVVYDCSLTSLEGLNSTSLQSLSLHNCSALTQLSGVGHLPALRSLKVGHCGVTSLQALSQLGEGLQSMEVLACEGTHEEVLALPNVQPTADVVVKCSNVREVVLAGGVRRAVGGP